MAAKKTTTEKGLGWRHQQAVAYLRSVFKDGSPCPMPWCGRPMWLDATLNYDYDKSDPGKRGNGVLQGDHSKMSRAESLRRGEPVLPPDRLLHAECNRMRGEGLNDRAYAPTDTSKADAPYTPAMPWPVFMAAVNQ
jgi:hypothetical protein